MPRTEPHPMDFTRLPLSPQRWKYVLTSILAEHNWRHATKPKGVSHATMADRRQFCFRIFTFLRDNPVKVYKLDPRSFSGRHVEMLMAHWRALAGEGKLGASSLQKYHSYLVTFSRWIDKPGLVKPLDAYFNEPSLIRRSYIATDSKAWRDRGVDVDAIIVTVEAYDARAAAALRLMAAFGLRFKEACMLRPHADVVTAAQAGKPAGGPALYLNTRRGTKGGRQRYVPIDDERRQGAVDYARTVAKGDDDSVSDPRLDLKQAIRHLRYTMERFGITKAGLAVTPHGLRHQYAAQEYERLTGCLPPVAGGQGVASDLDHQARMQVSQSLGHGRVQITKAYLA